jgi:hypothetical protein
MTHPQVPSIDVCLSWRPRGSGRNRECCCRIRVVLGDILLTNLFYIEDGFRGICSLNPKVDIVPMVFCLSKLSMGYHIGVKFKDKGDVP